MTTRVVDCQHVALYVGDTVQRIAGPDAERGVLGTIVSVKPNNLHGVIKVRYQTPVPKVCDKDEGYREGSAANWKFISKGPLWVNCSKCHGVKLVPEGNRMHTCGECRGHGVVPRDASVALPSSRP